jgi:hypothetical protein
MHALRRLSGWTVTARSRGLPAGCGTHLFDVTARGPSRRFECRGLGEFRHARRDARGEDSARARGVLPHRAELRRYERPYERGWASAARARVEVTRLLRPARTGIHRVWKEQFVRALHPMRGMKLLDCAGGTGTRCRATS